MTSQYSLQIGNTTLRNLHYAVSVLGSFDIPHRRLSDDKDIQPNQSTEAGIKIRNKDADEPWCIKGQPQAELEGRVSLSDPWSFQIAAFTATKQNNEMFEKFERVIDGSTVKVQESDGSDIFINLPVSIIDQFLKARLKRDYEVLLAEAAVLQVKWRRSELPGVSEEASEFLNAARHLVESPFKISFVGVEADMIGYETVRKIKIKYPDDNVDEREYGLVEDETHTEKRREFTDTVKDKADQIYLELKQDLLQGTPIEKVRRALGKLASDNLFSITDMHAHFSRSADSREVRRDDE
jgi:hypothetical protein